MQKMYNFKVDEELIKELDQLWRESKVEKKADFLMELKKAYEIKKLNNKDRDIDFSKYDTISDASKNIINDTFKHILLQIEANNMATKQELLSLESEKIKFKEKEENFKKEFAKLEANYLMEIKKLTERLKESEMENKKIKTLLNKQSKEIDKFSKINKSLEIIISKLK